MKTMHFGTYSEMSFWGNVDYESDKAAMLARNAAAKRLKAEGYVNIRKHSLPGQMSKYSGLGQPDGRIGTVYKISYQVEGQVTQQQIYDAAKKVAAKRNYCFQCNALHDPVECLRDALGAKS